jgi:hypothetical protein
MKRERIEKLKDCCWLDDECRSWYAHAAPSYIFLQCSFRRLLEACQRRNCGASSHAGIVNRVDSTEQLRTLPGSWVHETTRRGNLRDMSPDVFHGLALCSFVRNVGCWGGDRYRVSSSLRVVPVSTCACQGGVVSERG